MTGQPWRTVLWLIWLAWAVWITAGPFRWLVDAFRSPGPEFYRVLVWSFPAFAIVAGFYLWIRRFALWRYEPAVIAGACAFAFLYYRFRASLLLLCLFLACYAAGAWFRERLGLDHAGPLASEIPASTALGLALIGPLLFLLGILNLYYWWTFAGLFALPILVFHRHWIGLGRSIAATWRGWNHSPELRSPLAGLAIIYIAMSAAIACVMILAPSVGWDALHFHLREAFFYAGQHALVPVPALDYSYYPGAYEALLAAMVSLGGQPAAQLPSAMFFTLTCLLGFRLAREAGSSRAAAVTGIAAVATMPVFHWTASVPKNDLMMVWFELAALECFLHWRRSGNFRWILVAALLTASAFDVKHVALFGAIPLVALFFFAAWRQPSRFTAFVKIVFVLGLFGAYWHVRTFVLTGNPLFPETTASASPVAGLSEASRRWIPSPVQRYAKVIRNAHFDGEFAFERPLPTPLGILLVMFWPAWILFRRRERRPELVILLAFTGVYFAYWIHTYPVLRYALPALFLLFLLTAARAAEWFESSRVLMRTSLLAAAAYVFTFATLGSTIIGLNAPHLRWIAGRVDDRGYLQEALETYRTSEFLAATASPNDRVLGLDFFPDIYTPPFIHITGFPLASDHRFSKEFQAQLNEPQYQWIVAPRAQSSALAQGNLTRSYEDNHYVVFRIAP